MSDPAIACMGLTKWYGWRRDVLELSARRWVLKRGERGEAAVAADLRGRGWRVRERGQAPTVRDIIAQ